MDRLRLVELRDIARSLKPYEGDDAYRPDHPSENLWEMPDEHRIEHLHMRHYFARTACGTVGCLAGIAVTIWPEDAQATATALRRRTHSRPDASDVAAQLLKLDHETKLGLFHGYNERAMTPEQAATACQRVLDGHPCDALWERFDESDRDAERGTCTPT